MGHIAPQSLKTMMEQGCCCTLSCYPAVAWRCDSAAIPTVIYIEFTCRDHHDKMKKGQVGDVRLTWNPRVCGVGGYVSCK
jgi:hypothetical protein